VSDRASRRLVPRWFDAYPDLERIVHREGWRQADTGRDDETTTTWEARPGTLVTWHEDPETGVEFITVTGRDPEAVEHTIETGMQLLTPETYASAVEQESSPLTRGQMLHAVAMAAGPGFDEPAHAVLDGAMRDEDPYVRRYGIYASALLEWPQLWETIEDLAADDPEPAVRATAEEVLASRS
jgi:hypothetical protein